jgi:hypothetical protein
VAITGEELIAASVNARKHSVTMELDSYDHSPSAGRRLTSVADSGSFTARLGGFLFELVHRPAMA